MSFPALLQWLNVLVGRDPALRRYALMMLATGQFYALTIGVMCHASYMGLLDWQVTHGISAAMVGCFLSFYTLVRSGWTQRFKDPLLTFPLALVTQLLVMSAYVWVGSGRADVVILLSQTLVVSMFRLTPRQTLLLGAFSVCTLSVAQLGLWLSNAAGFGNTLALAHFLVCATALGIMTVVTKWVSDIRVRIHRQAEALKEALDQANVLATTDMLTGLMSRRSMMDALQAAVTHATAAQRPLSTALIDIDHFKKINDQHGHQCGDAVLKSFAAMAMVGMRDTDKLCRWGGEEFLLLLPDVDASQAGAAVDRLRQRIKELSAHAKEHPAITVSAGVAQWRRAEPIAAWLERADTAMYQAKSQGRDRCVAVAPLAEQRPLRTLGLVK